jgi:hypothetical protein
MAEHWNGGTGGKGSRPRPYSVSKEEFDNRWELAFGKKKKDTLPEYELNKSTGEVQRVEDNTGTDKNEYQDILSTEDAILDNDLEEYKRQAQEMWSDSCTTPRKK